MHLLAVNLILEVKLRYIQFSVAFENNFGNFKNATTLALFICFFLSSRFGYMMSSEVGKVV